MVAYRARSPLWKMTRKPSVNTANAKVKKMKHRNKSVNLFRQSFADDRVTASFRYVGPRNPDAAKKLGIV